MAKPNNFDVLKEMGQRNLDLRFFPFDNFVAAKTHSLGGQVTWGVNRETIMDLLGNKRFCGGLFIADKDQFDALVKELETQPCPHERLSEEGICRACGGDRRGI